MITIATIASNGYYAQFAKALAISAKQNFPDCRFAIEMFNSDSKTCDDFYKIQPGCYIRLQTCEKTKEREICSNHKGEFLKHLRKKGNTDVLLWIDADSLIMKPCNDMSVFMNNDICVRFKETKTNFNGVLALDVFAGVFSFGNSSLAVGMLKTYCEYVSENISWGSDQLNLARICAEFSEAKIGSLSDSFLDNNVGSSSYIWSLKCEPKEINGRFMKKREEFLKRNGF